MIPEPPLCWAPQTTHLVFLKTLHGKYNYEPILQRKKVRHGGEDSPPGRRAKNWQSRDPNAGGLSPEPGPFTTKRPCPTPRMRSKPALLHCEGLKWLEEQPQGYRLPASWAHSRGAAAPKLSLPVVIEGQALACVCPDLG